MIQKMCDHGQTSKGDNTDNQLLFQRYNLQHICIPTGNTQHEVMEHTDPWFVPDIETFTLKEMLWSLSHQLQKENLVHNFEAGRNNSKRAKPKAMSKLIFQRKEE